MRVTVADIDCSALRHNFRAVRARAGSRQIMAIVKANAYGHGMTECASIFREEGTEFLGVAFADEAAELRAAGDRGRIAVLTPPLPEEAELFCLHDLDVVACSLPVMQVFSEVAVQHGVTLRAHLYIDTGMRRDGIEPKAAVGFIRSCSALPNISFVGVCTHFATSDEADATFAQEQLSLFTTTLASLAQANVHLPFVHAANSGAVVNLPKAYFTLVRPGLTLYGYDPSQHPAEPPLLRPVMTLRTKVNSVRRVPAHTSVSYGRRYFTSDETWIATIPIGYGDGFTRLLSGKASCLIQGREFPIVGTICMDQCMVDTGDIALEPGEEVILIGSQGDAVLPANEIARRVGSIPYEVLTAISARVPRLYSHRTSGHEHIHDFK